MLCKGTVSLSPQTVKCIGLYRKHSSHFCYVLLGILESKKLTTCLPAECRAKLINDWTPLLLLLYVFLKMQSLSVHVTAQSSLLCPRNEKGGGKHQGGGMRAEYFYRNLWVIIQINICLTTMYFLHHILYDNIANTYSVYIQVAFTCAVLSQTKISGTQWHACVLHVKAPVFWVDGRSSDSNSDLKDITQVDLFYNWRHQDVNKLDYHFKY